MLFSVFILPYLAGDTTSVMVVDFAVEELDAFLMRAGQH